VLNKVSYHKKKKKYRVITKFLFCFELVNFLSLEKQRKWRNKEDEIQSNNWLYGFLKNEPPYFCGGASWNCANDHAIYDENPELEEFILNQEWSSKRSQRRWRMKRIRVALWNTGILSPFTNKNRWLLNFPVKKTYGHRDESHENCIWLLRQWLMSLGYYYVNYDIASTFLHSHDIDPWSNKRVSRVRYNKQTIPQDKFVGKISMTYILVTNSEVI
jgi:hypothetical protein